ncbi:hypothetical protein [Geoalkalibacter sp.]|uniref:hypothetical protein n=1 Tax=Geoalkalibacter sp. TaxID=3041440 RepID=UPI00272EBE8D|nr:hypothetical protein [Geoalkalibacter sp.]
MQGDFSALLQKAISHERLEGYSRRKEMQGNNSLFAHYAWNLALSESLYPALQGIEVALRNSMHDAALNRFGSATWFEGDLLHERDQRFVTVARNALLSAGKTMEPSRILAELSFGFWTSLFDVRYEQRLWPWLLKPVFPYMPRRLRTRAELSRRLNKIRLLRNRVFHHEPIWFWQDLKQQHRNLLETLSWINPAMPRFIGIIDRFPRVAETGCVPYHEQVANLFLQP